MTTFASTARLSPSFHLKRAGFTAGALFFCAGCVLYFLAKAALAVTAPEPVDGPLTFEGLARVIDGDTLEIAGQRVRLEGIDAPESAQSCAKADGAAWPCGHVAASALHALVAGKTVVCDRTGRDKYGRTLGLCFAEGDDINGALVRAGYAWAFVKFSQAYVAVEAQARAAKAGVWQGAAQAPWDFRHNEWQTAEVAAPQGCAIKGNISNKGHIYHVPWSPWYERVTISQARGERWFCSEAEAMAAGWRAALPN